MTMSIEFAALTDVFYKRQGTEQEGEGCRGMLLNLDEPEKQLLLPVWSDECLLSREAHEEFTGASSPGEHQFSSVRAAIKSLCLCLRTSVSVLTQEKIIMVSWEFSYDPLIEEEKTRPQFSDASL